MKITGPQHRALVTVVLARRAANLYYKDFPASAMVAEMTREGRTASL